MVTMRLCWHTVRYVSDTRYYLAIQVSQVLQCHGVFFLVLMPFLHREFVQRRLPSLTAKVVFISKAY